MNRTVTALATLVVALTVTACGSEHADAPKTAPLAAVPTSTPNVETPIAVTVRTDARIGEEQAADGLRVMVMSYDETDSTATVQIYNTKPVVINPSDFVLTTKDGTEIPGVSVVAEWDVDLAANDSTMGPVGFPGASEPITITYAPAGARPLFWSVS